MKGYRKASIIIGESSEGWREGEESVAVGNGLHFARELAGTGGTIWLVMSTLGEFNRHRGIRDALGLREAGLLASRGVLPYDGQTIRHASKETIHSRGVEGSILTVFPRPELLAALDDLQHTHALVVVPGLRRDVAAWVDAWGPLNFATGEFLPKLTISNKEVQEAVEAVVARANNLHRPPDEKWARKTFSALRKRHTISANEVRAFVVRETHWRTDDADQLAKIAAGRSRAA